MPRVAFCGNFGPPWSTENDVREAFELLGWQVSPLQENNLTATQLQDVAGDADLLLWTSTWEAVDGPNYCPTTVTLHDALDVLHHRAIHGLPSAAIHLDVFWDVARNCRRWHLNPMWQCSTVFTADGDHDTQWAAAGVNHVWLPPAVRTSAAHEGTMRPEYACDVAFVGSDGRGYHPEWSYRSRLIKELRAMCDRNGWVYKNPGGSDPKVERGETMNDFYASARVTVGDSLCPRREASLYWSDRAFEAPGRGGFLIMPRIDALAALYDNALPTYEWDSWDDLETKVAYYLMHDYEREEVRSRCHDIARQRHTYLNRALTVLDHFGLSAAAPTGVAA